MQLLRPSSISRDLLRLVVWLAVLQAVVRAAVPAPRPPQRRVQGHPGSRDLDRCRPAPAPTPAGWSGPTASQSAGTAAERPHRTRRGRRAPSARHRGCRGGRGWCGGGGAGAGARLLIGHLNIQSLKPKILELSTELNKFKYDILTLNETWLRPSTPNRLLVVPGYQLLRADRPDGRGFGGVAVLVRDGISVTLIKNALTAPSGSKLESLWALIKPDGKRQVVIGSVYRPPRRALADLTADFSDLEAQFQRMIIDFPASKIIICGDLNCDLKKPANDCGRKRLDEFLSDFSLFQCVDACTYQTGSLLDVLIASTRDLVERCSTRHCHFSPHKFVRAFISVPRTRSPPVTVRSRSLRNIDVSAFYDDLMKADWRGVYSSVTVTDKWNCFLEVFLPIVNAHAPFRSIRLRNPTAPAVSDEARDLMRRRRQALAESGHGSSAYRDLNRAVRSVLRRDTREDIRGRIAAGGAASMWRSIRSVVSGRRPARIVPNATPDQINEYFVSVGPRVAGEVASRGTSPHLACRLPRVGACALTLSPLTIDGLRSIVFTMNCSSTCGEDGVCMRLVRLSFDVIGAILLHLVNSSLSLSEVPLSWKHSLVFPIFKAGDFTDPSNYRPISIVPTIAKIVERAVHQQLYSYLSSNHLLSPSQHGFRPGHSTETALTSISDHILSANDRGEVSLLCILDLSKCFDVIDHSKLLTKLCAHGIDPSWFSAYLQNHTQSVSITDTKGATKISAKLPNNIGVFQGSSLGPLLFCIFANDLSLFAEDAVVVQYADDTQLLVSGPKSHFHCLIARLERILTSLDNWFRFNGLKINVDKTQLMLLGSQQNVRNILPFQVKFRDHSLSPCSEAKNLGLIFDPTLSWNFHISFITKRCFGILSGLSHLKHCLPHGVITTLVSALVLSQIRYCLTVYGNGTRTNISRIQKILNYSAKVIFGRRKFDHVSDLLQKLGWLTADDLVTQHTLTLIHKIRRAGEPEALAREFHTMAEARDRSTRQDSDLTVPRSRTEMGKRRFCSRAALMYNALPRDMQRLPVCSFKRAVKRHLQRGLLGT